MQAKTIRQQDHLSKTFSLGPQNVVVAPSQNMLAVAKSLSIRTIAPSSGHLHSALTDGGTPKPGVFRRHSLPCAATAIFRDVQR